MVPAQGPDVHGFLPSREAGPLVARLVRRLDELPLALELAAARADSLGSPSC
jgi:predicted ATPase